MNNWVVIIDKKAIKLASPGVAKSSLIAPFKKVLTHKISNTIKGATKKFDE